MAKIDADIFEQLLVLLKNIIISSYHQVKLSGASVTDARCHAGFDAGCLTPFCSSGNSLLNFGAQRCAVDEGCPGCGCEKAILLPEEDFFHRCVVGDDRENDIRIGGDVRQFFVCGGSNFLGEFLSCWSMNIVDGGHVVIEIVEMAGHVGSHSSNANETNFLWAGTTGSFLFRSFFAHDCLVNE